MKKIGGKIVMTKAELVQALRNYRDDSPVVIVLPGRNESYPPTEFAIDAVRPESGDTQIVLHKQ